MQNSIESSWWIFFIFAFLAFGLVWWIEKKKFFRKLNPQYRLMLRRGVQLFVLGVILVWGLDVLGVDMKVVLGTAGVLTVVLGFAAQTTASNLVSGIFLLLERPFKLGDLIEVEGVFGKICAIDLLSVKVETFSNLMVRVPSENLLKGVVTNHTHHPYRRLDIPFQLAYKEDLEKVRSLTLSLPQKVQACLLEPQPSFYILGFEDSGIKVRLSAWALTENYWDALQELYIELRVALKKSGIEIPFPHLSLYAGEETKPFPFLSAEKEKPTRKTRKKTTSTGSNP